MLKIQSPLILLLFGLFSGSVLADALLMNGLASHKELNKDVFIGAVFTEQLSQSPDDLLNQSGNKRMELRVTAKRLSVRRLGALWVEGMAINNPTSLLTSQAKNMAKFTSLIKRSLKAGDNLVILGHKKGSSISLNGVELGNISSPDFFNMALRTWIGSVPLSSDFRNNLLTAGEVNDQLLTQFQSVQPGPQRVAEIESWNKTDTESTVQVAAPATATEVAEPQLATVTEPASEPQQPESETPAETKAPIEPEQPPQSAEAIAAAKQEDDNLDDLELTEDDLAPLYSAESILNRQLYHAELIKWAYKHIRYPKRSVDLGQEGSVRISVIINRQGKVQEVLELEKSKYSRLNKAAHGAIKRASPFPAMPDTLTDDIFTFTLPIAFRLN